MTVIGKEIVAKLMIVMAMLAMSWVLGPGPGIRENSFQIKGDGFHDQLIKLGIKAHEFENNYYAKASYNYFQEYQNLTVRVSGANNYSTASPVTGIHIDFNNFSRPGKYTLDSLISVSLFFKKDIPSDHYDLHYVMDENGVVEITRYEPVGGLIEGTFSGSFVKMKYNSERSAFEETDVSVTISNGKFSVIHFPDYHWDAPQSVGSEPEGFKDKKKKSNKN